MRHVVVAVVSLVAASWSCASEPSTDPVEDDLGYAGTGIGVTIAPLDLPSVSDACYSFEILNGAGDRVVARGGPVGSLPLAGQGGDGGPAGLLGANAAPLCSTRFGNGRGALSYVAPCDASAEEVDGVSIAEHTVRLWVNAVCASGSFGAGDCEPVAGLVNPCGPDGCAVTARCVENADVPVTFNFTLMASAQQGFFDVAVNFGSVFCSAKLDTCYDVDGADERPIELLFGGSAGRQPTAVLGFACTAGGGEGAGTWLHTGDVEIACDGQAPVVISLQGVSAEGNQPPVGGIHWAAYYGAESLEGTEGSWNKEYFNVALTGFGPGCTVRWTATASDGQTLSDPSPPGAGVFSTYPIIRFGPQAVTEADGAWICSANDLNGDGSSVSTVQPSCYTPGGCLGGPCVSWQGGQPFACEGPDFIPCGEADDFGGGSGTPSDPFLICTIEHLAELDAKISDPATYGAYAFSHYRQVNDLDFEDEARSFLPIGDYNQIIDPADRGDIFVLLFATPTDSPFMGDYDGAGRAIRNLRFESEGIADFQGLFLMLGEEASVRDLRLEGVAFSLADSAVVGSLAAVSIGRIDGVHVTGLDATLARTSGFGGLVGGQLGGGGLRDVSVSGAITGSPVVATVQLHDDDDDEDEHEWDREAETDFIAGVVAFLVNVDPNVTTGLREVVADVSIDAGGDVAGVVGGGIGQFAVEEVTNLGALHSRSEASGVARVLVGGDAIGIPGLAQPAVRRVVNHGSVLVTGEDGGRSGAAGVAGSTHGTVLEDVHNHADITNLHARGGGASGLVGSTGDSSFDRVSNTGDITNAPGQTSPIGEPMAFVDVAGLIGYVGQEGSLTLSNCMSTGHLSGGPNEYDIGGLVADIWQLFDGAAIIVENCYASNTFSGGKAGYGSAIGIIDVATGQSPTIQLDNIYWNTDKGPGGGHIGDGFSGNDAFFDAAAFVGLSPAQMEVAASFVGFDFVNIWFPPGPGLFPQLR